MEIGDFDSRLRTRRGRIAFPILAVVLFQFFFAASAPVPLFVVFQARWGFSPGMLTMAFGIYSLALLTTLLVAGSLSDHVGRRPVIVTALLIQVAAMALYLWAHDVIDLIAARVVQGLSMGMVNGALSAALIEAAPPNRKRLGALFASVSPLAGLAAGALTTGFLIGITTNAEIWLFGTLCAVCFVCTMLVCLMPETANRRPGLIAALVPRISVARPARRSFVEGVPLLLAIWALCGFVIALGPSLMQVVFAVDSGRLNGLSIAVLCGAGALSPLLLPSLQAARAANVGLMMVAIGLVVLIIALEVRSLLLFFLGDAIAGAGLGVAFAGLIQSVMPLVNVHERAELFAAVFMVTYLSLSLPPIAAGFLIDLAGLLEITLAYFFVVLGIALAGVAIQARAIKRMTVPAFK